jgi:predicted MFS family arabinose efflux permease
MRVRPSRPLLIALSGSAAIVLPVVGLIQPLPVPVVAMAAFLAGIAVDIFEILWQTSLAQNIPSDSLSRVSAYDYFGSLALTPLGLAAAGPIVEHFGTRTASIICAVLVSVELIALLDPQVRNLRAARPAVD